uniref:BTB domain-containing protein n=1 Tax=Plectus sambesii TaxID=2011161 RepID=A0A914UQ03_9BILA
MGANGSLARRPTEVGESGEGSRRRRTRRSHSMPVNPPDRLAPSATQRRPAPRGITAKGRSVYAAVRHRLTGCGSKAPAVPLAPICRVPPALKGKAARDHAKTLRELVSGWSAQDLHCLVVELESAFGLRELSLRADSSRPVAATLRDDLAKLYRSRKCSDVVLIYLDREFPAHSSILRRRSAFFHNLLSNTSCSKRVKVAFPSTFGLSTDKFNSLLFYLYTGELPVELRSDVELIAKLKDHFGALHSYESDMFSILDQSASHGDATLLFTASHNPVLGEPVEFDSEQPSTSAASQVNDAASGRTYSVRCDGATVAARSPLLRALLERRRAAGEELTIVLDENVIPRIYAPVILHAMHTDHVDLSKVMRGCLVSASSLS